jgi:hypothetical protein
MNYKTLVAASLASLILTSDAFAQCAECALYPERDHLNGNVETPAAKMGLMGPGGAAGRANNANPANNANNANANNARAEVGGRHLQRSGATETTSTAIRSKKSLRSRDSGPQ